MDIAAFRAAFPEFADIVKYPDATITFWQELAEGVDGVGGMVIASRWKSQATKGIMLYVAHELVLAEMNQASGVAGGTPGGQSGPANSKTVGSVTVAYDTQQGAEKDAGWWNLTSYGKQFYRLSRIYGSGMVQL